MEVPDTVSSLCVCVLWQPADLCEMFTCCDFCMQVVSDNLGLVVGLAVISELGYRLIILCLYVKTKNVLKKKKQKTHNNIKTRQRAPMNFNEHIYSR